MKTSSAKAKGRRLQQFVRDGILCEFPYLEEDDVRSTSMGAGGEDILLSPKARKSLGGLSFECKSRKSIAIYRWYDQAKHNAGRNEPVLIIKENRKKPLVVVDFEFFVKLLGKSK